MTTVSGAGDLRFEAVDELVAHVQRMLPYLNSRPDLVPRQWAAACLARCSRLLSSMIELRRAGFPDIVGLPARSLLECWYLGMYLLFAPEDAHDKIVGAHLHQLDRLDGTWGDVTSAWSEIAGHVERRPIKWDRLANHVGDLLVAHGHEGARFTSERLYEVLFRSESALSVHGGLGVFVGHVNGDGTNSLGIVEVRPEPEDGAVRIRLSAALVGSLARGVALAFGMSLTSIDDIGRRLAAGGVPGVRKV